jgi:hypothetical protein
MLRRTPRLDELERKLIAGEPADYHRGLAIYEALWREAVQLGVLPSKDPLEGLEAKVRFVKALHALGPAGEER